MKTTTENTKTIENLETEIHILKEQNNELSAKLKFLEEQFRLSQQKRFGRSSEQTIDGQINIFNEAEIESDLSKEEPTLEEITYKRKKQKGSIKDKLKDLPVETIEYKLSQHEQVCPCCDGKLHEMSTQVREEVKFIPASACLVKHIQYIYACRKCEKNEVSTPILKAPMPKPPIPKSFASSSAIAYVINQKYINSMPLYRQEQDLKRLGIEISRGTLANWIIKTSNDWLNIIYNRMKYHLIKKDILHADETGLQVLNEPNRKATTKSYMWLYRTGRSEPPIILYEYRTTRSGKCPEKFLEGFKGYLNVDAYGGYNKVKNAILIACWAHAKRYFVDALKAMPDKDKKNKFPITQEGIDYCNKLFSLERKFTKEELSYEERYEARQKLSKPVITEFEIWLNKYSPKVLPKSGLGKAIKYCKNQLDDLKGFLKDGRLEMDNNRAERTIRNFVMGRKNWLFSNSQKGADSSAIVYSVVESAKENNLIPFKYIEFLLNKLPNMDIENLELIDKLLPWSEDLPDELKLKK
jgi:transposase